MANPIIQYGLNLAALGAYYTAQEVINSTAVQSILTLSVSRLALRLFNNLDNGEPIRPYTIQALSIVTGLSLGSILGFSTAAIALSTAAHIAISLIQHAITSKPQ